MEFRKKVAVGRQGTHQVKFIYSEKATNFCRIFPLLLSYIVPVKSKVKILQNFLAFWEYMNFTKYVDGDPFAMVYQNKNFFVFYWV